MYRTISFLIYGKRTLNQKFETKSVNYNKFNSNLRKISSTNTLENRTMKTISESSVIIEDGLSILEMPCIIQIINGEFEFGNIGSYNIGTGVVPDGNQPRSNVHKYINHEEESEMMLGFMKCSSHKELFSLLETCPQHEITPIVALTIMKRYFQLENNVKFRNADINYFSKEFSLNFTQMALLKSLKEIICSSGDSQIIVDTVHLISRERSHWTRWEYVEQVCIEALILAANGQLKITQACDLIKSLYNLDTIGDQFIDKVWMGISDQQNDINEDDLCDIACILPFVQKSRRYLTNIFERRIKHIWFKLKPEHIIKILKVLVQLRMSNDSVLFLLTNWSNSNFHLLTEGNLRWIIFSMACLEYTNNQLQKVICRYLKVRGNKIKDHSLISLVTDYFSKMHIRHTPTLDLVAEYFIMKQPKFSITQVASIIHCFGHLSYVPQKGIEFFEVLQFFINEQFAKFPPDTLLDILLSCAYLEQYFPTVIPKIFYPSFLGRIQSLNKREFAKNYSKLRMLDFTLSIEMPDYKGPFLSKKSINDSSMPIDSRVMRAINKIRDHLEDIVGEDGQVSYTIVIPDLPSDPLYVIDSILNISSPDSQNKSIFYALLIHTPDHFDITQKYLIGPQLMKIRHLESLGINVINLRYTQINKLYVYPEKLKKYIKKHLNN